MAGQDGRKAEGQKGQKRQEGEEGLEGDGGQKGRQGCTADEKEGGSAREGAFVAVARVGDLQPGHACQVTVHDRWVGLFNIGGRYFAIDNLCLHRGGPLCEGTVAGTIVTCPWHGWQFDVPTGTCVQDPVVGVTRHEVRIVGDEVQVALTD